MPIIISRPLHFFNSLGYRAKDGFDIVIGNPPYMWPSRKRQAVHPLRIIRCSHKCYSREMIFLETFRFLQHLLS
ncbi:Eco57I restriction-modification methylase domain-containing protein [Segatella buccae]|uniref:Eco57I restriction-modification methylase domain-containing protein n=1 Tax=Segatella buccae TaxID=28126 RepID=UPI0036F2A797